LAAYGEISFTHMPARTLILLLVIAGFVPSLDAQYIRIGNAGAIPSAAMTPPTILESKLALYTDDARTHGIEGTVTIEAAVGENGQITGARVLKGLGFGLDEVALASIREWVLSPATRNGLPVSVVAQMDVEFNLRSANAVRLGPGWALGMVPPTIEHRVEPKYTDEARRMHLSGTIVLQAVIRTDGTIDILRVVRGLPAGLTDSAIEAIKQWQFKPGQKDGQNTDIGLNVEVNFNLAANSTLPRNNNR
jgi:TonB family protein